MNTPDIRLHDPALGFSLIRKTRAVTNPERHFHSSHELLYILSGERTFFYANRTFFIKSGDFLCIEPGVLHRALNRKDEVCDLCNIYFDNTATPFFEAILPLLAGFTRADTPVLSIPGEYRMHAALVLKEMAIEMERKKPGYIPLTWGLLFQWLVEVSRYEQPGRAAEAGLPMNLKMRQVIDWLSLHYREPSTLASLSRRFSLSRSHLSRLFRQSTRFSFVEYLNTLRIREACRLLTTTRLTVTEISGACGFGSITQFGRFFRKITGDSPRSYRKKSEKTLATG